MIVTVDTKAKGAFYPPVPCATFDGDGVRIPARLFWIDTETGEAVVYPDGPLEQVVDECGEKNYRREWRQFKPPIRIVPLEGS